MSEFIKEIVSQDNHWKVQIFQRDDGWFGFKEFVYSYGKLDDFPDDYGYPDYDELPEQKGWCEIVHSDMFGSECIAASAQIAESEARSRLPWLQEQNDNA